MYTEKNMKGHSIWNSWFLFFSWGARMFFWFSINNFKINNILNYNLQSFYYKTKSIILKSSLSASNSTPPSHPPKILRSPRKNSSEFNALLPKKVWNDEKEDRNVMKFCLPLNPPPQKKIEIRGWFLWNCFVDLFYTRTGITSMLAETFMLRWKFGYVSCCSRYIDHRVV